MYLCGLFVASMVVSLRWSSSTYHLYYVPIHNSGVVHENRLLFLSNSFLILPSFLSCTVATVSVITPSFRYDSSYVSSRNSSNSFTTKPTPSAYIFPSSITDFSSSSSRFGSTTITWSLTNPSLVRRTKHKRTSTKAFQYVIASKPEAPPCRIKSGKYSNSNWNLVIGVAKRPLLSSQPLRS